MEEAGSDLYAVSQRSMSERILPQTKDVITTLQAVGLERHEFQARCERIMNGRTFVGYGDVHIALLCSLERQRELAPKLAEHFPVTLYTRNGAPIGSLHVGTTGAPGLTVKEVQDASGSEGNPLRR